MGKNKKNNVLTIAISNDIKLSFKGAVTKSFKLVNNRKRVYLYDVENLDLLFEIDVKPSKDDINKYRITILNIKENAIVNLNEMSSKYGDIKIIGINDIIKELKISTVMLKKED